jgi:phosphotransferase system enzyme I (PtsI)
MEIKKGIAVSPGVAIQKAFVLDSEDYRIPERYASPEEVPYEIDRFEKGLAAAKEEIRDQAEKISEEVGDEYLAIFQAHMAMLSDEKLSEGIVKLISEHNFTAEYAVSRALRKYIRVLKKSADRYLAERVDDIYDIERRLLRNILGEKREQLKTLKEDVVIIAVALTPSQAAGLDKNVVRGFATDAGGRTSHTAIVARALQIPAVVGLETVTSDVSGGDLVIIDGNRGIVIVSPDEETLKKYRKLEEEFHVFEESLIELKELPCVTTDGRRVALYGNIEFPEEIETINKHNADGVGLFRTEFLFIGKDHEPTEKEHFETYYKAVNMLDGKPLVIRTMDMGADKLWGPQALQVEKNPFLGCRSIRLSFVRLEMFKTQLRAILRASAFGKIRVLFPMISVLGEIKHARLIMEDVMEELKVDNVEFDPDIHVGIMAEVPSAVLDLDRILKEVDFISIGTNDLIQYTIAVDRANERVASLYEPCNPAVLKLLKTCIEAGRRHDVPVAMCGEMSGDILYTLLLLGLGLQEFSVSPAVIPEIKKIIRSSSFKEAKMIAEKVESLESSEEVVTFLSKKTQRILPEAF